MRPAAAPKAAVASSPGRAERFPAPALGRLLRGKSAASARSRARSSPMFASRSKSVGCSSSLQPPTLADEPSSPKVTCIGQVRIRNRNRRKNRPQTTTTTSSATAADSWSAKPRRSGCRCLKRALFCSFFNRKKKKKNKKRTCRCPYGFFLFCWPRKTTAEEAAAAPDTPPPVAFIREIKLETESEPDEDEEEEEEGEETRVFVSDASAPARSPPKNALLLMRCRSAPHNRSSALALSRFPVSPAPGPPAQDEAEGGEKRLEGIEEKGRESCNLSSKDDEDELSRCSLTSQSPAAAALMRCKSEPAKRAERLMEVGYSKLIQEVGPTPSPPPVLS